MSISKTYIPPPDPEDFDLRLLLVLGDAGRAGRLSWIEVEHVLTLTERYEYLADERFWAIYESLNLRTAAAEDSLIGLELRSA